MIAAITLENFKGIREPVKIELKPITLLFGANSAGKSTIVQALHYTREILERRNIDSYHTLASGEAINLGGFKSIVHKHNINESIVIKLDLDLSSVDGQEYGFLYETDKVPFSKNKAFYSWLEKFGTIWVNKTGSIQYTIAWNNKKSQPFVKHSEFGINDIKLARFSKENGEGELVGELNVKHPIFDPINKLSQDTNLTELWVEIDSYGKPIAPSIYLLASKFFELPYSYGREWLQMIATRAINGLFEYLCNTLRSMRYLGPIRQVPSRDFKPAASRNEINWANGIEAWQQLYLKEPYFISDVNKWMASENKLNTGYKLHMKNYKLVDCDNILGGLLEKDSLTLEDIKSFKSELASLPKHQQLSLIDLRNNLEVQPQDIGIGISQLLPVVVAALDTDFTSIIAIEQPELHIHPAMQVKLGDLFITQINKRKINTIFLLETHSEHLLLRLLRRIRETNEGELPLDAPSLTPEKVSVIYVEQTFEGVKLAPLRIDETGEFIDRWPKGFFEERAEELF
jgi:predicted ATPase